MPKSLSVASALTCCLLIVSGCAAFERRHQEASQRSAKESGPALTPPSAPSPSEKPSVVRPAPARVGLVLGPGGFKAFAHVGVMKELLKARVPIHRIIGFEWGAMVAGLYAQKAQIHDVEWKLYKFEQSDLPGRGFFSGELKSPSVKSVDGFLQDTFAGGAIASASVPFACPAATLADGALSWQEKGGWSEAIRRCLAFPPMYSAAEGGWVAAPFVLAEAVQKLKREGVDVVLFVNVLADGDLVPGGQLPGNLASVILWQELRRQIRAARPLATEWIDVDTGRFDLLAVEKRRELVKAGEVAGQQVVPRLIEKYGF